MLRLIRHAPLAARQAIPGLTGRDVTSCHVPYGPGSLHVSGLQQVAVEEHPAGPTSQ